MGALGEGRRRGGVANVRSESHSGVFSKRLVTLKRAVKSLALLGKFSVGLWMDKKIYGEEPKEEVKNRVTKRMQQLKTFDLFGPTREIGTAASRQI